MPYEHYSYGDHLARNGSLSGHGSVSDSYINLHGTGNQYTRPVDSGRPGGFRTYHEHTARNGPMDLGTIVNDMMDNVPVGFTSTVTEILTDHDRVQLSEWSAIPRLMDEVGELGVPDTVETVETTEEVSLRHAGLAAVMSTKMLQTPAGVREFENQFEIIAFSYQLTKNELCVQALANRSILANYAYNGVDVNDPDQQKQIAEEYKVRGMAHKKNGQMYTVMSDYIDTLRRQGQNPKVYGVASHRLLSYLGADERIRPRSAFDDLIAFLMGDEPIAGPQFDFDGVGIFAVSPINTHRSRAHIVQYSGVMMDLERRLTAAEHFRISHPNRQFPYRVDVQDTPFKAEHMNFVTWCGKRKTMVEVSFADAAKAAGVGMEYQFAPEVAVKMAGHDENSIQDPTIFSGVNNLFGDRKIPYFLSLKDDGSGARVNTIVGDHDTSVFDMELVLQRARTREHEVSKRLHGVNVSKVDSDLDNLLSSMDSALPSSAYWESLFENNGGFSGWRDIATGNRKIRFLSNGSRSFTGPRTDDAGRSTTDTTSALDTIPGARSLAGLKVMLGAPEYKQYHALIRQAINTFEVRDALDMECNPGNNLYTKVNGVPKSLPYFIKEYKMGEVSFNTQHGNHINLFAVDQNDLVGLDSADYVIDADSDDQISDAALFAANGEKFLNFTRQAHNMALMNTGVKDQDDGFLKQIPYVLLYKDGKMHILPIDVAFAVLKANNNNKAKAKFGARQHMKAAFSAWESIPTTSKTAYVSALKGAGKDEAKNTAAINEALNAGLEAVRTQFADRTESGVDYDNAFINGSVSLFNNSSEIRTLLSANDTYNRVDRANAVRDSSKAPGDIPKDKSLKDITDYLSSAVATPLIVSPQQAMDILSQGSDSPFRPCDPMNPSRALLSISVGQFEEYRAAFEKLHNGITLSENKHYVKYDMRTRAALTSSPFTDNMTQRLTTHLSSIHNKCLRSAFHRTCFDATTGNWVEDGLRANIYPMLDLLAVLFAMEVYYMSIFFFVDGAITYVRNNFISTLGTDVQRQVTMGVSKLRHGAACLQDNKLMPALDVAISRYGHGHMIRAVGQGGGDAAIQMHDDARPGIMFGALSPLEPTHDNMLPLLGFHSSTSKPASHPHDQVTSILPYMMEYFDLRNIASSWAESPNEKFNVNANMISPYSATGLVLMPNVDPLRGTSTSYVPNEPTGPMGYARFTGGADVHVGGKLHFPTLDDVRAYLSTGTRATKITL